MMTTGYDCLDLLNLFIPPRLSPTDFIQIKGRGARKHNFLNLLRDESRKSGVAPDALPGNIQTADWLFIHGFYPKNRE